jgi:hypothetical protein
VSKKLGPVVLGFVLERFEVVRYDRPSGAWDRIGGSGPAAKHFRRSNRLVWVANEAEPRHPSNRKRTVELTGRDRRGAPARDQQREPVPASGATSRSEKLHSSSA